MHPLLVCSNELAYYLYVNN